MPTATDLTYSFDWTAMLGVFNTTAGLIGSPMALTIGLMLAMGVGAFVVNTLKNPSQRQKRRQRLKKAKTMPRRRSPGDLGQAVDIPAPPAPSPVIPTRPTSDDPVEQAILDRLLDNGPAHIDDITQNLDLPAHQVSAATTMLELKGVVKNEGLNISLAGDPAGHPPAGAAHDETAVKQPRPANRRSTSAHRRSNPSRRRPRRASPRRLIVTFVAWLSHVLAAFLGEKKHLAQGQMFERELTPVQENILAALDERRRSGKKVKELVGAWADLVLAQPDPNQLSFLDDPPPGKEELVDRWLKEPHGQVAMVL